MSEKPQHEPDVSRETLPDDPITPEQAMLNEIMDRAMAKSQTELKEKEAETAPKEEAPSQEEKDASPTPPEKNKPSSAYVYLAVLFGAAFLMLLLAYFVQQRNNDAAMDDLRMTTNASKEELLEEIKQLEAENHDLQNDKDYLDLRLEQIKEEREDFRSSYESANNLANDELIHRYTLEYFWYIDQFMKNKDYPMAAAAVLFYADSWRSAWNSQISVNPVQIEQYKAYRQELIDRGYLEERPDPNDFYPPEELWFTQKWDPSQRDDMAALCTLWCALGQHFIYENDACAAQYLCYTPIHDPLEGYQDHIARQASDFTLEQFQIMKDELVKDWFITVLADGKIIINYSASHTEEQFILPFQFPETWNWKYS